MQNKELFLSSLRSRGKHKYSRYKGGLPLRYAGGKSLAVGHVIEAMPDSVTEMVSPFFGGGSVEIACATELGIKVKGYDVFDILATYWQVQLLSPKTLADILSKWQPDLLTYRHVKEVLRWHWKGTIEIHRDIDIAAHYWFNHNLSYGPGFLGWMSKIYKDVARYKRMVDRVRMFHCPNLRVSQGSFDDVIPQSTGSFLYCDPPYYLDGDSKMFRGIYPQRNFPVHHDGFNHQQLAELLHEHQGGFVLSYNDCEAVRDWYKDFEIREVKWQYTLGQGETRIGKNRAGRSNVKQSHELIIVGG